MLSHTVKIYKAGCTHGLWEDHGYVYDGRDRRLRQITEMKAFNVRTDYAIRFEKDVYILSSLY
jgi:hypothetical protein